jgi:hypothetical protein
MELATFSDIEFVGIAADRHILIDHHRRQRRDSFASSTVSLVSANSEIERLVHSRLSDKKMDLQLRNLAGMIRA